MFNLPALNDTVSGREVYDEGMSRGLSQGLSQGLVRLVSRQAAKKFGRLPRGAESLIQTLDYLQLEALGEAVLDMPDAKALLRWLAAHKRQQTSPKPAKREARR